MALIWLGAIGTCLALQALDPEGPYTAMATQFLKYLPIFLPIGIMALMGFFLFFDRE